MSIKYHTDLIQGSEEWLASRCGLLTASEMKNIITPTLKIADNDKSRAHLWELAAQRITQYVEPHYISDDMLRGQEDEIYARAAYTKNYAPAQEIGFITNDKWGFTLGYSPDAIVGNDGLIECKSRRQKFQIETIITGEMPEDYKIQVQTALLVSERKWLDFISYSGGLPMFVKRVLPDAAVQASILTAATVFHGKLAEMIEKYKTASVGMVPTERRKLEQEITI